MITPKTKRNLLQLLPWGLIWLCSGWVFLLVELAASNNFSELPTTAIRIDFQLFILSSGILSAVGLLMGFIELKYLHQAFFHKNFAVRFLYKLLVYSCLFFIVVLLTYPVAVSLELNLPIQSPSVWNKYLDYFTSMTHLSTGLQLATALVLSLFYAEISSFIGQGVLRNFFTGKYHSPIEEERIFMFADMKSSTSIAEQLGHLEYFKLLQEYYNAFTDTIIQYEAEIYQYVGDEIVLSWKFLANHQDLRCLDCFYAMKANLIKLAPTFMEKFGCAPSFKAGIHFGKVTVGEIGVIKKDILFSGDVLNATARIQGLCNSYQKDLLLSGDFLKQLRLHTDISASFIEETTLKGKVEKKELYTLPSNP